MIPPSAIKPIRKNGRDSTELAVGTLIAYRVFPLTEEGIDKAKKTIAKSDEWLVPSLLPEYYDGIDSDLMTGKENDSIRAITKQLKEFYGISSASTVDAQVYTPADKFVDDSKEFADKIIDDLDVALEEKSDEIMDAIDAIIAEDNKRIQEFKSKVTRQVNHPKLFPELQHIKTRYMWGQNGLYDLEFKSDIDRAIYFAGKLGGNNKDSQDKSSVREWLFLVTGLNVHDDYEEIKKYRTKILELILQLVKLAPNKGDIIVPPVYDGYYQDPDEDEEEEDEEDLEDDNNLDDLIESILQEDEDQEEQEDDILENLDDLIDDVRSDDEEENEDIIPEGLDDLLSDVREGKETPPEEIDASVLDDLPSSITDSLVDYINKKKGVKVTGTETKEKTSSSVSNKKLLNFLTTKLTAIENELNNINNNIINQTVLIQTGMEMHLSAFKSIVSQDQLIGEKFDRLAEAIERQNKATLDAVEKQKRDEIENKLEQTEDTARTLSFVDLSATKKKGRSSKISGYYLRRLRRLATRKLPRSVRLARLKAKQLKRQPAKIKARVGNKILSSLPKSIQQKALDVRNFRNAAAGTKGIKGAARSIPGLRQALSVIEYADRKAAGQTDVQAMAGVGGGLAGAAAGAAIGTMLFPGVGTVAGLLIGAAFSAAGAAVGSKAADVITGADNQYERGGVVGNTVLHGTELVVPKDQALPMPSFNSIDPVGGTILAATSQYISKAGPAAQSIAPVFKQVASPLASYYDVPPVLVQTNIGGNFPSMQSTLKKIKEKRGQTPEEELEGIEKDLLETKDPKSFAEKLLKIIDPEGKFQDLLKKIKSKDEDKDLPDDLTGITGDLKGNIVNPMEEGQMQDYAGAKFGADRPGRPGGHKGRDIMGPPGMKVVASLPGNVLRIYNVGKLPDGGWSKGIDIDHGNGIVTKYMHVLPSKGIKPGVTVRAGQQIAVLSPEDDISQGSHLHFEIHKNGVAQNPETFLKKAYKLSDIKAGKVPGLSVEQPTVNQLTPGEKPTGITTNEVSGITDTRNPSKLIIGAGHVDEPGKPGSGSGTAANGVRESSATQHVLRALQRLVQADPQLKDKIGFASFNNDNFARDNMNRYTNRGMQFLELHFDQRGGGGRSGLIPSRNARQGVTGNAGTSAFDVALSRRFGNYGANFKRGDLGIPDTGGSILELGAIDSNAALLKEVKEGRIGPETMKLAQYTFGALKEGAVGEGWVQSATPVNKRPKIETMNQVGTDVGNQFVIINQANKPRPMNLPGGKSVSFVPNAGGGWRTQSEVSQALINKIRLFYQ